jgi:predicted PhzF superfamily epimerase YddE/YHI9
VRGDIFMKQYIVDAFTDKPFSGNSAAVCVMDYWPSESSMMNLAMENNLSETAFIVKEEKGYHSAKEWFASLDDWMENVNRPVSVKVK